MHAEQFFFSIPTLFGYNLYNQLIITIVSILINPLRSRENPHLFKIETLDWKTTSNISRKVLFGLSPYSPQQTYKTTN